MIETKRYFVSVKLANVFIGPFKTNDKAISIINEYLYPMVLCVEDIDVDDGDIVECFIYELDGYLTTINNQDYFLYPNGCVMFPDESVFGDINEYPTDEYGISFKYDTVLPKLIRLTIKQSEGL